MIERLKTLLQTDKNKAVKIIVAVGLVALCGIFLSESVSTKKSESNSKTVDTREQRDSFCLQTQERLQEILSRIDGIGACAVMVTLESGEESVYSSDTETSAQTDDSRNTASENKKHVIIDSGGETPVLEKEIEPRVRGVIVVCEGADDVSVREAVIDCVRAGLGISVANISVVRGGKND